MVEDWEDQDLPVGTTPFSYWVLAPFLESGFAIVGELAKVVPAAKQRISAIESDPTSTSVELMGKPSEKVAISYVYASAGAPGNAKGKEAEVEVGLSEVECIMHENGEAKVTCKAATRACLCDA
jgi:hypothetical protein